MTVADAPATIVWLDPAPPDASREQAIADWAKAHGITLVPPSTAKLSSITVDAARAEIVETALDRARDAIAARDAPTTDAALAAAEAELRAHPELPQAAWLMAEVERARSTRFRLVAPLDADAADRAWSRAEALDGGRVPGVGEVTSGPHPADASVSLQLDPGAVARFDGRRVAESVATHAGSHAVVVSVDDLPVWAQWIETPAGPSSLHPSVPSWPPCSSGDVAYAHAEGGAIDARAVRCGAWVAAAAGPRAGSVTMAVCAQSRCGAWSVWSAVPAWTYTPPHDDRRDKRWPTWATWGLVGAGAALVTTGVVLVATGAFQSSAPAQARFVSGGLKTQSE